jgi:hypothetical protein
MRLRLPVKSLFGSTDEEGGEGAWLRILIRCSPTLSTGAPHDPSEHSIGQDRIVLGPLQLRRRFSVLKTCEIGGICS